MKRPLLRYHGGKFKDAKWIISNFPPHDKYNEVFGGSASVLFNKNRARFEIYNELNKEISNLFEVVRDYPERLANLVYFTPYSKAEFELSYQICEDKIEMARRTLVRSFMGFGTCVTAKKKTGFRRFARSRGASPNMEWNGIPENILAACERLKGVLIENIEASECLLKQDSITTLHYVDPPYLPETRSVTDMYFFEMTENQHIDLADTLNELQGMVIISGYASELYDKELFKDWRRITKTSYADGAKEREEVLWMNFDINSDRRFGGLFSVSSSLAGA